MAAENTGKRVPSGVVFIVAVAVGIFVALQAHELWFVPDSRDASRGSRRQDGDELAEPLDIGDLLYRPGSVAGLRRLDAEPGGIVAPPKARRHAAFERRSDGRVEQMARYSVQAESYEEIIGHYRAAAGESGFELIGETDSQDARVLVFQRNGQQASLRLRRQGEKAMMIGVMLKVTLPTETEGGSEEER